MYMTESCSNKVESGKCKLATKMTAEQSTQVKEGKWSRRDEKMIEGGKIVGGRETDK